MEELLLIVAKALLWTGGVLFVIYVAVRLAAAAVFQSKIDYEERTKNGQNDKS